MVRKWSGFEPHAQAAQDVVLLENVIEEGWNPLRALQLSALPFCSIFNIMVNAASPSTSSSERKLPNIVITGTPGTGKTSHAQAFLEACPFEFQHLVIGDIVKEKECHEGWNEEWQSYDVDDEKVSGPIETSTCMCTVATRNMVATSIE